MKKIRKSWLRASIIIALLVGVFVTLNAMKEASPVLEANIATWYFIGDSETDPFDPANYQRTPIAPCGTGEEVICEILAPKDLNITADQPLMTAPVLKDIKEALKTPLSTNATVQRLRLE